MSPSGIKQLVYNNASNLSTFSTVSTLSIDNEQSCKEPQQATFPAEKGIYGMPNSESKPTIDNKFYEKSDSQLTPTADEEIFGSVDLKSNPAFVEESYGTQDSILAATPLAQGNAIDSCPHITWGHIINKHSFQGIEYLVVRLVNWVILFLCGQVMCCTVF